MRKHFSDRAILKKLKTSLSLLHIIQLICKFSFILFFFFSDLIQTRCSTWYWKHKRNHTKKLFPASKGGEKSGWEIFHFDLEREQFFSRFYAVLDANYSQKKNLSKESLKWNLGMFKVQFKFQGVSDKFPLDFLTNGLGFWDSTSFQLVTFAESYRRHCGSFKALKV